MEISRKGCKMMSEVPENGVKLIKNLKETKEEQIMVEKMKPACNGEEVRSGISVQTQHLSYDMPKRHVNEGVQDISKDKRQVGMSTGKLQMVASKRYKF